MTPLSADYERMAEDYARARRDHLARHGDPIRRFIEAHVVRGGATLDAGCGSGEDLLFLAKISGELIGLDRSPAMLRLAAEYADNAAILAKGDIYGLPFSNCRFDTVVARFVLQYVEDPDSVHREFARVLRDRGHLILLLPHPSLGEKGNAAGPTEITLFDGALKVAYPVYPMNHYLSPMFHSLFAIEAMHDFHLDPTHMAPSAVGIHAIRRS